MSARERNAASKIESAGAPLLSVEDLRVCYGNQAALAGLSFTLEAGQWLMLSGPNGAGKSSALGAIAQSLPYTGRVCFCGEDMRSFKPRVRARRVGMLSQRHALNYAFTVREVAALGRYAYTKGLWNGDGDAADNERHIQEALRLTGMLPLADRSILTLSGGEVQRTFLAQLFAQDPAVLLLDEPSSHLDLRFEQQVFDLIRDWLTAPGRAVISVVHDLSLALAYGTHGVLLHGGETIARGEVRSVLSRETLQGVYDMDVYAWMQTLLSRWR